MQHAPIATQLSQQMQDFDDDEIFHAEANMAYLVMAYAEATMAYIVMAYAEATMAYIVMAYAEATSAQTAEHRRLRILCRYGQCLRSALSAYGRCAVDVRSLTCLQHAYAHRTCAWTCACTRLCRCP